MEMYALGSTKLVPRNITFSWSLYAKMRRIEVFHIKTETFARTVFPSTQQHVQLELP